jgi:hypothetical protein
MNETILGSFLSAKALSLVRKRTTTAKWRMQCWGGRGGLSFLAFRPAKRAGFFPFCECDRTDTLCGQWLPVRHRQEEGRE